MCTTQSTVQAHSIWPPPNLSTVHLDSCLRHLMAFPDRTLVCLYLMSFVHSCFLSGSSSSTYIFLNEKHQRNIERGWAGRGQMRCWHSVCCVGLMLLWYVVLKSLERWNDIVSNGAVFGIRIPRCVTHSNHHVDVKSSADMKQSSCAWWICKCDWLNDWGRKLQKFW